MQLADEGEVFGHFVIPYVDDEKVRALFKAVSESAQKRPGMIREVEATSIAGECDLLLHLYTSDFRVVVDLQAEVTDAYSLASSWLYAIPYGEPRVATPPDQGLQFYIYLRVHRHFYACYGTAGERVLHDAVSSLLKEVGDEQLSGRILYSLGWPDLIVHGHVSGDLQHLRRLILALQALSFPTTSVANSEQPEKSVSVFLKTISVMGLPMELSGAEVPTCIVGQGTVLPAPVLFGRSRPGLTPDAIGALRSVFERSGAQVVASWAVNGTWDFVVTAPTEEPISLERFHQVIRESWVEFARHGIERTQTHLLTSREAELELLKAPRLMLRPPSRRPLQSDHCACGREDFEDLRQLLGHADEAKHLPRGLTRTISHALSMFQHTLREPSNCCDAAGALRAHAQGLGVLLELSLRAHALLERTPATAPDRQALIANEISFINAHLAEWCKRAGRVVRERTAGSAARLFLQIDSIVAQRGAIPKILMIAERIMEDFHARLPSELPWMPGTKARRSFAAILEPQGNVTSQPLMGLVSIPIRYAFALHFVVPQLWHEVGQHVFWAEYSPSQRMRVDLELSLGTDDPDKSTTRLSNRAFGVDYHLRADMFADVMVFCFGFRGSVDKFFRYLSSLTANVAKHDRLHEQSWSRQSLAMVHRLCFIMQFVDLHERAREEGPVDRGEFHAWRKEFHRKMLGNQEGAEELVRYVVSRLQRVSSRSGWPKSFPIPPDLAPTVASNFRTDVYKLCLDDMEELAFAFRDLDLRGETAWCVDWEQIKKGDLVDLPSSEALQAAYLEFYLEELDAQLLGPDGPRRRGQFRKMATLGRSALLHIYQTGEGGR